MFYANVFYNSNLHLTDIQFCRVSLSIFTPVVESVIKIRSSRLGIDCRFLFLTFSVIFSVYVILSFRFE